MDLGLHFGSPGGRLAVIFGDVFRVFFGCDPGSPFKWILAPFWEVVGVMFEDFSLSLDFAFCVAPAIPKPNSGRPKLMILGTCSVTFSEVGSGPRFFVFLGTFGIPLGILFGSPVSTKFRDCFWGELGEATRSCLEMSRWRPPPLW